MTQAEEKEREGGVVGARGNSSFTASPLINCVGGAYRHAASGPSICPRLQMPIAECCDRDRHYTAAALCAPACPDCRNRRATLPSPFSRPPARHWKWRRDAGDHDDRLVSTSYAVPFSCGCLSERALPRSFAESLEIVRLNGLFYIFLPFICSQ